MPWLLRNAGLQALMPYVDWSTLWAKGPAWLSHAAQTEASSTRCRGSDGISGSKDGEIGSPLYDRYLIHTRPRTVAFRDGCD